MNVNTRSAPIVEELLAAANAAQAAYAQDTTQSPVLGEAWFQSERAYHLQVTGTDTLAGWRSEPEAAGALYTKRME